MKKWIELIKLNYDGLLAEGIEAIKEAERVSRYMISPLVESTVYVALFEDGSYRTYVDGDFPEKDFVITAHIVIPFNRKEKNINSIESYAKELLDGSLATAKVFKDEFSKKN